MKLKNILTASVGALLLITGIATAAPSLSNLHMAKNQVPAKTASSTTDSNKTLKAGSSYGWATQVGVVNRSSGTIYVSVLGSTYDHSYVLPGDGLYFYSDDYFDYIQVQLFDQFGDLFFCDYVPNGSTLYVDDSLLRSSAKDGQKAKLRVSVSH